MKRVLKSFAVLVASLICLVAFFPMNSVVAQSQVVISNSDFEQVSKRNNSIVINDWSLTIISSMFVSKDENSYSGAGLVFSRDCTLTTQNTFSIGEGQYTAGFYLKSESTAGTASVKIELYDENRSLVDTAEESVAISQFDWSAVAVEFCANATVQSAKLEIKLSGINASCYLDSAFVNEKIQVEFPEITTMPGASLRLVADSSGIRFHGKVNKEQYDKFIEKYPNASVGMLVTVKENIDSLSDFTVETLIKANKIFLQIQANKFYNLNTAEQDGYYGFYCVIANLLPKNIRRQFVFRTYVKCVVNNVEYIDYGEYNENYNARSVYEIACKLYENIDAYDEVQQGIIKGYINSPAE